MTTRLSKVSSPAQAVNKVSTWVQTERSTHEAWGRLSMRSPRAAAMAHFLCANMENTGAVVISYATLSKLTGMSIATVRRAIDDLKSDRWIEVVQVGGKGGANAFVINSRVAWAQSRDKLHLSAFSARVIADKEEQQQLDDTPLRRLPSLYPGEKQLPTRMDRNAPIESLEIDLPDLPSISDDPVLR